MAPSYDGLRLHRRANKGAPTRSQLSLAGDILEAWGEGFNVGALIILILVVICNIRRGVLLHKLILLELFLAVWHGTFIFCNDPTYGWYLSSTATLLFISYQVHNVVAWLKIRPFLPRWGSVVYMVTLCLVQPYWIIEAYTNFEYFNGLGNTKNTSTRPWEALARDPWWIFTTVGLIYFIRRQYNFGVFELVRVNSRFGVMLLAMFLSIVFLFVDVVVSAIHLSKNSGINPYWRLSLVFKCASDAIFLDDFKKVLDSLHGRYLSKIDSRNPSEPTFGGAARDLDWGRDAIANRSHSTPGPVGGKQDDDYEVGQRVMIHSDKQRDAWEQIIRPAKALTSNVSISHGIRRETMLTISHQELGSEDTDRIISEHQHH